MTTGAIAWMKAVKFVDPCMKITVGTGCGVEASHRGWRDRCRRRAGRGGGWWGQQRLRIVGRAGTQSGARTVVEGLVLRSGTAIVELDVGGRLATEAPDRPHASFVCRAAVRGVRQLAATEHADCRGRESLALVIAGALGAFSVYEQSAAAQAEGRDEHESEESIRPASGRPSLLPFWSSKRTCDAQASRPEPGT